MCLGPQIEALPGHIRYDINISGKWDWTVNYQFLVPTDSDQPLRNNEDLYYGVGISLVTPVGGLNCIFSLDKHKQRLAG